jgi:hypothetical protein
MVMPDFSVLDYGGIGIAALILGFSFWYINKSTDYLRTMTEWSIHSIAEASQKQGDTNRRTAETLKRLADQFERSQAIMCESFTELSDAIERSNGNNHEWRAEERREHEQLLLDHREGLKIIRGRDYPRSNQ